MRENLSSGLAIRFSEGFDRVEQEVWDNLPNITKANSKGDNLTVQKSEQAILSVMKDYKTAFTDYIEKNNDKFKCYTITDLFYAKGEAKVVWDEKKLNECFESFKALNPIDFKALDDAFGKEIQAKNNVLKKLLGDVPFDCIERVSMYDSLERKLDRKTFKGELDSTVREILGDNEYDYILREDEWGHIGLVINTNDTELANSLLNGLNDKYNKDGLEFLSGYRRVHLPLEGEIYDKAVKAMNNAPQKSEKGAFTEGNIKMSNKMTISDYANLLNDCKGYDKFFEYIDDAKQWEKAKENNEIYSKNFNEIMAKYGVSSTDILDADRGEGTWVDRLDEYLKDQHIEMDDFCKSEAVRNLIHYNILTGDRAERLSQAISIDEGAEIPNAKIFPISQRGMEMEDFQNNLAERFGYKNVSTSDKTVTALLSFYYEQLPEEFKGDGLRAEEKGFSVDGKNVPLYSKDGTLLATGYDRVVIGEYGAFIEVPEERMKDNNIQCKKGQEYRLKPPYVDRVKYQWMTSKGGSDCKIYKQMKPVTYADYKAGKYYISPYEVCNTREKELIKPNQELIKPNQKGRDEGR